MKSIKLQLILVIACVSVFTAVLVSGLFVYNMVDENNRQIENYRESLVENSDRELKVQVEAVVTMIDKIHREQLEGKLTEAEARNRAAAYVRDLRYDDGKGYFWIDTYEGINVALLGRDIEGKSRINLQDPDGVYYIKAIIDAGRQEGGGYANFMFAKPGETTPLPKRSYSVSFKPYGWVIGTGMWTDYIDSRVAQQQELADANLRSGLIKMLLYVTLILILFIIAARFIGQKFAAPIVFTTEKLDQFARGDFTGDIPEAFMKRSDEFGVMVTALASLQKNIRDLLREITTSAEYVASASEELTATAEQSSTASSQVADSITSVAESCNKQLVSVDMAHNKVDSMSKDMETVTTTIRSSADQVKAATAAAHEGGANVVGAVAQMSLIEQAVDRAMSVIAALGEQSQKIGTIVDTIGNIAGQTNLLALNAAIEAARAGEHGRGFAVVAEEVRKLAEQSQSAAKQIGELIAQIQGDTQNAVDSMSEGTKQVKTGSKAVDAAGESFKIIDSMVAAVAAQSSAVEENISHMVGSSQAIVRAVQEINAMSRSVAGESQTVSAATEEQTASLHEISRASESLAQMAQTLQEAIHKFRV